MRVFLVWLLVACSEPVGSMPSAIDLAEADCNTMASTTFGITNRGNEPLTYTFEISDPAFTIMPATGTVEVGATTSFTVTATVPADAMPGVPLTATVTAKTNLDGGQRDIPITVTPRGARITITTPTVGFGQIEAGTTSSQTVVVANTGNAPADITIGAPGGDFARTFGDDGVVALAGGEQADATFAYSPSGLGADAAEVTVLVSGAQCGSAPTSIALAGEGLLSGTVMVQGALDFGEVACGTPAATDTLVLANTTSLAAPFSAVLLADAEGDHLRYTVSPADGVIPPNDSITLTVRRLAITLPATPRAYDATLRITTTGVTTTTDVPVTQTLAGPFLVATPSSSIDFGFASLGKTRTASISIQNTGTKPATITSSTTAPFALQLPATVNVAATSPGTAIYQPTALGAVSGTASIQAAGACSARIDLALAAGDGPEIGLVANHAVATCPVGAQLSGSLTVTNTGNRSGSITCTELTASDLAPQLSPSPLVVAGGASAPLTVTVLSGSPVRAGTTQTTLRCTTNEPAGNQHDVAFERQLNGVDLVLTALDPLDFTCSVDGTARYTITSSPTSNQSVVVEPTADLVSPLLHDFSQGVLAPGDVMTNQVINGSDPCATSEPQGTIIFTGSVGAGGSNVCSVTPASLPVVLRAPAP